jgi:hypothetical protein
MIDAEAFQLPIPEKKAPIINRWLDQRPFWNPAQ